MPSQPPVRQSVIKEILNARTPDALSRYFAFPVAAQDGNQLTIFQTPADLAEGYAALTRAHAQMGHSAYHARIVAIELPFKNRFRVWVDWLFTDQHGNPCTGDRAVYFCRLLRGQPAVEMIQCHSKAGATIPDQYDKLSAIA